MDISDIKYGQKFWHIKSHIVTVKHNNCLKCLSQERYSNEWTYKIEPCFVYSINLIWNGEKTFDVCPIDFLKATKEERLKNNWKWKFEVKLNEIDNFEQEYGGYIGKVFTSKAKAKEMYKLRFSDEQRKIFRKLNRL